MAILASYGFNYRVVLDAHGSSWRGRADSSGDNWRGLVGDAPEVEIADGALLFHRTDDVSSYPPRYYGIHGAPLRASFEIGEFLRTNMQARDCLHMTRGGYGELRLGLFRRGELVLGLGRTTSWRALADLTVTPDPRIADVQNYHLRGVIDDPEAYFLWLDASQAMDVATVFKRVPEATARVVVAITGADRERRRQMNNQIGAFQSLGRPLKRSPSLYCADVDPRVFPNQEAWLAYIRGLPRTRPADFYLRFHYHGRYQDVMEGSDSRLPPWHIVVRRVGTLWEPEQIAVTRDPNEPEGALREALRQCSEARMTISW